MKCHGTYLLPVIPVLLLPIGIFPYLFIDYYYISTVCLFSSWVILWNYPKIGHSIQSKPLYVEDLISDFNNIGANYKFMEYYTKMTNFSLAILVTISADYAVFKNGKERDFIEILAVLGGVMALYLKCQDIIAKILLFICYYLKNMEAKKREDRLDKIRKSKNELKLIDIHCCENENIENENIENENIENENIENENIENENIENENIENENIEIRVNTDT
jgi:hypothetical protein